MNWLEQLLFDSNSIAHIVLLYTAVISLGVYLGKIKFFGISLGVTFVLFAGILAGHFGFTGPVSTLNFLQDFGLILFVYCIGLQVGPGFFESFKKGGVTLNLLACGIVALNILVMLVLYYCVFDTNDPRNLPMMVGVLCGAGVRCRDGSSDPSVCQRSGCSSDSFGICLRLSPRSGRYYCCNHFYSLYLRNCVER